MIELESLRNALGSLVRQVLRVALRTLVGLCALCALVGGITAFSAHRLAAHGGLAVVITVALTLAVTPYIAIRGALGRRGVAGAGQPRRGAQARRLAVRRPLEDGIEGRAR